MQNSLPISASCLLTVSTAALGQGNSWPSVWLLMVRDLSWYKTRGRVDKLRQMGHLLSCNGDYQSWVNVFCRGKGKLGSYGNSKLPRPFSSHGTSENMKWIGNHPLLKTLNALWCGMVLNLWKMVVLGGYTIDSIYWSVSESHQNRSFIKYTNFFHLSSTRSSKFWFVLMHKGSLQCLPLIFPMEPT